MHARGPQFGPEVSHGIQANDVGPLSYVNEEYFRHFQKHFRVLEVQVYLVRAECGPCYYRDKMNPFSKSGWTLPEVVSFDVRVRITPI